MFHVKQRRCLRIFAAGKYECESFLFRFIPAIARQGPPRGSGVGVFIAFDTKIFAKKFSGKGFEGRPRVNEGNFLKVPLSKTGSVLKYLQHNGSSVATDREGELQERIDMEVVRKEKEKNQKKEKRTATYLTLYPYKLSYSYQ